MSHCRRGDACVARFNPQQRNGSANRAARVGPGDRRVSTWTEPSGRRGRRPYAPALLRIAATAAAVAQIWVSAAGPVLSSPATPYAVPRQACDLPARTPDEITALLETRGIAT